MGWDRWRWQRRRRRWPGRLLELSRLGTVKSEKEREKGQRRVAKGDERRGGKRTTHDDTLVGFRAQRGESSSVVQSHVEHLKLSMSERDLLSELGEGGPGGGKDVEVRTRG